MDIFREPLLLRDVVCALMLTELPGHEFCMFLWTSFCYGFGLHSSLYTITLSNDISTVGFSIGIRLRGCTIYLQVSTTSSAAHGGSRSDVGYRSSIIARSTFRRGPGTNLSLHLRPRYLPVVVGK